MPSTTPVNNFMVPATGTPNSVPVQGPFSATPTRVDFREISLNGEQFVPQGFFADNSAGAAPIVITIEGMNYSIAVPVGAQMQSQYPAPIDQIVNITGNGAGTVVFCDFPVLPFLSSTLASGGGPVTIADGADVTLGAQADAPAANDTGVFSLMALFKRLLTKIPVIGTQLSAASMSVTLASDDAQIGTKITAAPALGAGGTGLIGWLSNLFLQQQAPNTGSPASPGLTGADQQLLASNIARKGFTLYNDSVNSVYVLLGSGTATVSNFSILMLTGATFVSGPLDYTGEVRCISAAAGGNMRTTIFV